MAAKSSGWCETGEVVVLVSGKGQVKARIARFAAEIFFAFVSFSPAQCFLLSFDSGTMHKVITNGAGAGAGASAIVSQVSDPRVGAYGATASCRFDVSRIGLSSAVVKR